MSAMNTKNIMIAEIKNALQYPHTILEIMSAEDSSKNRVSRYCIADALKEIKHVVKQLNKLAGWDGEKSLGKNRHGSGDPA